MKHLYPIAALGAWIAYAGCFLLILILVSAPTAPDSLHNLPIFDHGMRRYMSALDGGMLIALPTLGVLLTLCAIIFKRQGR